MGMTDTPVTLEMALRDGTKISWSDYTFNPWIGCARVSPACTFCYAEARDNRFDGGAHWGKNAERRRTSAANWRKPIAWDRRAERDGVRRRVFCASLADVFEARDDLDGHRADLWRLIEATPNLDWLLLTKRPEQIMQRVPNRWVDACDCMVPYTDGAGQHSPGCATFRGNPWPHNVWVGTTVEDQTRADERIDHLVSVPAPVRFLSCEPLLGPVDLSPWMPHGYTIRTDYGTGVEHDVDYNGAVDWVLIGGESGPHARPMSQVWARSLIEQCETNRVACHMKQAGAVLAREWGMTPPGHDVDAMPPAYRVRQLPEPRS